MLLEKLVEYANVQLATDLPPAGYQAQPIRYIVDLDATGSVHGLIDTASNEEKRGAIRLAPHAKRAMGIVPKLLADTSEYVLGIARNDPKNPSKPERVAQQFAQFQETVERCAADTKLPGVVAVEAYLKSLEPGVAPGWLPKDFDSSATITFRVGGRLPIDDPTVRAWWAASRAPEDDVSGDSSMGCIICGNVGPVLERHPLKIKRIPGSMPQGYDLISANAAAFESYGLKASKIAPTCATCAEAYGNALNAILGNKTTSLWSGGLAYAFWTDPKAPGNPFAPVALLKTPHDVPGQVAALLKAAHAGKQDALFLDPTAFYCVALGASGARVVVKDWIDTTVGRAQESFARYFALQDMVTWDGQPGIPLPLSSLARAVLRQGAKMTDVPPDVVTRALLQLAYKGTALPDDVLFMAVRRNRAEQSITRERAVLIRMAIDGVLNPDELKENKMAGLDRDRTDPAYVCGRLLAIADQIQFAALGKVNSSVVDKFFGSASSNPGLVFPIINRDAQHHLKRLARDNSKAKRRLEAQMDHVASMIQDYPPRLTLREQGLFGLGFYHQRAFDRAARIAGSEAKIARAAEQKLNNPDNEE